MGKYIVELKKNETLYKATTRESDGTAYVCSAIGTPYTEPDLEQIKRDYDAWYEKGLADAWEAAKKIALMDTETSENVTGYFGLFRIMENLTPMQAIEKIRQYEQENRFRVGDEFETESGNRFVITKMDGKEVDRYIDGNGTTYCMIAKYKVMRKTGRHFPEIAAVLQKMKEANNG